MLRLLHVTRQGLQGLVALLAPDALEHVLYPRALGGLADPLGLPGAARGRRGRARAHLRPGREVDEAASQASQVRVGLTGLLHLIEK